MARTVVGLINAQVPKVKARLEQHPPPEAKALRQAQDSETLRVKSEADDWVNYLLWDAAMETAKWQAVLTPQQVEALRTGAQATIADLGVDVNFSLTDPRVRTYLAERKQVVKTIVANRESELRASLTQGYEAGENLRDLMARVDQYGTNGGYRAERIARTEVNGAMNAGSLEGMIQAGIEYKQWVTTRDKDTRDAHEELDGTVIPVDEDFESPAGGSGPCPLQMGNAADDVNCRCTAAPVEGPEG